MCKICRGRFSLVNQFKSLIDLHISTELVFPPLLYTLYLMWSHFSLHLQSNTHTHCANRNLQRSIRAIAVCYFPLVYGEQCNWLAGETDACVFSPPQLLRVACTALFPELLNVVCSVCPSTYPSMYLSTHPSVHTSTYLSIYLSAHILYLSIFLTISIYLSMMSGEQ